MPRTRWPGFAGMATRPEWRYTTRYLERKYNTKKVKTGAQAVEIRQGLFLFDADWDTLRKDIGRVDVMPWVQYEANPGGVSVYRREADVVAGESISSRRRPRTRRQNR